MTTASICTVSDSSGRRSGTDEGPGNEDVPTRWSFPRVSVRISTAERSSYRASTVYTAKTISSAKPSVFGQLKLKRNRVIQDVYQPTGGCVALLVNPNLTKSDQLCTLLDDWTKQVSRERCYGQLNSAVDEDVVVDESGHMKIPWLESEDRSDLGVDILLATATNPTIVGGHYPSAQQVAAAWNSRDGRNYVDYFCKNRACGIKTFQDDSIQENLRALWQQKGVPQS